MRFISFLELCRLNKPIGILLLLWPTLIALWIAGNGHPDPFIVFIFVMGVIVMRSVGCIINDLTDQGFDGQVNRTKNRPLVVGKVSRLSAFSLTIFLLIIALWLVLQLNLFTILLAFVALGLAIIYPFIKRVSYYPQVVLGLAFAFSIPMAFAAELNSIPWVAWVLYFATVFWVVAYDTQYAMVDKQDDLRIGVKSTAIIFGHYDRWIIVTLQFVSLMLFGWAGVLADLNFYFYVAIFVACFFVFYQWTLIYHREPTQCFKAFLNNGALGACLFLGVLLGYNFN